MTKVPLRVRGAVECSAVQVLVGTCVVKAEEEGASSSLPTPPSIHPKTSLPVDTTTDSSRTRFHKVTTLFYFLILSV